MTKRQETTGEELRMIGRILVALLLVQVVQATLVKSDLGKLENGSRQLLGGGMFCLESWIFGTKNGKNSVLI